MPMPLAELLDPHTRRPLAWMDAWAAHPRRGVLALSAAGLPSAVETVRRLLSEGATLSARIGQQTLSLRLFDGSPSFQARTARLPGGLAHTVLTVTLPPAGQELFVVGRTEEELATRCWRALANQRGLMGFALWAPWLVAELLARQLATRTAGPLAGLLVCVSEPLPGT
jgi:hypothetical protein